MNFKEKYVDYSAVDFIMNDDFFAWIISPTKDLDIYWNQIIDENPELQTQISQAKYLIKYLRIQENKCPEYINQKIWENLKIAHQKRFNKRKSIFYMMSSKNWKNIAASLIIFFSLMASFLYWNNSNKKDEFIKYTTPYGKTARILLPDSSLAVLNSNSSIQIKSNFLTTKREVWLSGEVFFNVKKLKDKNQKLRSFEVHSNQISISVLGTTFNVKNRKNENSVVLNSGKIKLSDKKNNQLILLPGDFVSYSNLNKNFTIKKINPEIYSAWASNKFIFEQTSLQEIIYLFEDNYGLNVKIQDSTFLKEKITGNIPTTDLNVLINALEESFNLNIKQENKILIITKKRSL